MVMTKSPRPISSYLARYGRKVASISQLPSAALFSLFFGEGCPLQSTNQKRVPFFSPWKSTGHLRCRPAGKAALASPCVRVPSRIHLTCFTLNQLVKSDFPADPNEFFRGPSSALLNPEEFDMENYDDEGEDGMQLFSVLDADAELARERAGAPAALRPVFLFLFVFLHQFRVRPKFERDG